MGVLGCNSDLHAFKVSTVLTDWSPMATAFVVLTDGFFFGGGGGCLLACLISFDLEMHRKVLSSIHLCLQCALSSVSPGPRRPQGIFRKRLSEMGKNQTELFYAYGRRDLNWFCGHNSA